MLVFTPLRIPFIGLCFLGTCFPIYSTPPQSEYDWEVRKLSVSLDCRLDRMGVLNKSYLKHKEEDETASLVAITTMALAAGQLRALNVGTLNNVFTSLFEKAVQGQQQSDTWYDLQAISIINTAIANNRDEGVDL